MHGQTIWHEPPAVSWQLGEPAILAERFGVRVVSNFRARDVAAGGQGAPLVPIADLLLFGHPEQPRVLLNLGGMANLTFVPRRAVEDGAFAFDTGPGVALIDAVTRMVDPALRFDRGGALATKGASRRNCSGGCLAIRTSRRRLPRVPGGSSLACRSHNKFTVRLPGRTVSQLPWS